MKKRIIGILLTLVVATQVFPVDGLRFWSNLVQSNTQATTASILALEEEEVEEIQFKVKIWSLTTRCILKTKSHPRF